MENKRFQDKPDIITFHKKIQELYNVADFSFVRRAFQSVVFDKLFLDGYVCCTEGLFPSNKENLVKNLRQKDSIFYSIIERNASSYKELIVRFEKLDKKVVSDWSLSYTECQSIVYAILEAERDIPRVVCVNEVMYHYFGKTRFSAKNEFIIADDIALQEIASLEKFIAALEELPNDRNNMFRGHSNINYGIQPSLFRNPKLYRNEYMMYQELVIRCPESFTSCQTHLDFLVEMQHYGLPTRLLDFSLNPLVALYFACETTVGIGEIITYSVSNKEIVYSKSEKSSILSALAVLPYKEQKAIYAAVHSCDPKQHNEAQEILLEEVRMERPSFKRRLLQDDVCTPIFVKSPYGNKRIAHQSGIFLLWGLDSSYYGEENPKIYADHKHNYRYVKDNKKVVFYVPSKRKSSILKSLDRIGINKAYIYPEIDDVADYIKNAII